MLFDEYGKITVRIAANIAISNIYYEGTILLKDI